MKSITINPADNVGVLLEDADIARFGHKIALHDIKKGEFIIKYGFPIGIAINDIKKGEWVHTHNLQTNLGNRQDYEYNPNYTKPQIVEDSWFEGYLRHDGAAGVRNEIWIIPTVGCISKTAEKLAECASSAFYADTYAFVHPYGCSQLGDDQLNTQKLLAGLIKHPNTAGVLVLGLGCENNSISELKKVLGEYNSETIRFLECQKTDNEMEKGLKILKRLAQMAKCDTRVKLPVSKLTIGLKCGGSDSFSGITANPLVGSFSDMLIKNGGTAILTEVPEMFGAETLLLNRRENITVFNDAVNMINGFKDYFISNNQPVYENPSPGNKEGGITTLEEKSLGCTQKSGSSMITGVLGYGEKARQKGLNLLNAPGNDLVASTALAASGAQIILFTTGRGTPFGTAVPTLKISTNTALYANKKDWIDFNAGEIINGADQSMLANQLFSMVIKVASGQRTKNELNDYRDIAIFKTGVTL